ncbi:MAG TPA: N-acetylmuramoyl-L-alanine amidase [Gaiellaceae bacterium]|nr:N-acetylmuramoyl-L-alanine amidase [Gaiellaceae bacterium]
MKKALIASAIALVFPAAAQAGLVTMVSRDVPLGPRALQAAVPPMRFNMIGIHWQGSGQVEYRTESVHGTWSSWIVADADTGPDEGSSEQRSAWHDGNLDWVGASQQVRFKTEGQVSRVRAYYLNSRITKQPARTLAVAGLPAIVPRASWQADEAITHGKTQYAPALKLAIVHHTAGSNNYTEAEAPAIVRGIEVYHVQGNGWNDIGYNFLVDRFGTVYEGRAGGIDKNVIGAQAEGFNTGSVGVALIGNFARATPPPAMQNALVNLLAWRLDVAHIDPLSTLIDKSRGNYKYKLGTPVKLRAISGHRDTGPSDCPGNAAYALLPTIAQRVSMTGLPKLYSPLVSGKLGGDVRFQGRLSSALPWTVTVSNAAGTQVAQGKGHAATVAWTWNATKAGSGPYRWEIDAGSSVLPASGTLGVGKVTVPPPAPVAVPVPGAVDTTALSLTGLVATPSVITPNPDGTGGYSTVDFSLSLAAVVTVKIVGTTSESPSTTLLSAHLPAGDNSFEWNLAALPNGAYNIVVTAKPVGQPQVSQQVGVTIDRTVTGLTVTPALISPNGDGSSDTTTIGFTLAQPVTATVLVERQGSVVATAFSGQLGAGQQSVVWSGLGNGARVPDGAYDVVVQVSDALGTVAVSAPLTLDTTPPVLTLLDAATLRFQLTEPALVTATVNGTAVSVLEPAGVFTIPWQAGPVTTVSAQAGDSAGNLSAPATSP